jgi:hypothetical protein
MSEDRGCWRKNQGCLEMYKVPEDRNFYEYMGTPNSRDRKARTGLFGVLQTSVLSQEKL